VLLSLRCECRRGFGGGGYREWPLSAARAKTDLTHCRCCLFLLPAWQTPFFTFPIHFDCYGNVLAQLTGRKRVLVFPREAVRMEAGRAVSHEMYDVREMLTDEGQGMVEQVSEFPGAPPTPQTAAPWQREGGGGGSRRE
jgi:hypothetical protein